MKVVQVQRKHWALDRRCAEAVKDPFPSYMKQERKCRQYAEVEVDGIGYCLLHAGRVCLKYLLVETAKNESA